MNIFLRLCYEDNIQPLQRSHLHFLVPGDQSLVELFVLALLLPHPLLIVQIKCQVECLNHFHPLHTKEVYFGNSQAEFVFKE